MNPPTQFCHNPDCSASGQRGLGNLILQFNVSLDIAGVFAVLVMLSVMGVALHLVMQAIQKRVIFWAEPDDVISA